MVTITEELSTYIEQPFSTVNLFPFQLASVYEMEKLEKKTITWASIRYAGTIYEGYTSIGILGNKVGSGKTNILLALAKRSKMKFTGESFNIVGTDSYYQGYINIISNTIIEIDTSTHLNVTLVIVPHTILTQWISEIKKTSVRYLKVEKPENFEIPANLDDIDIIICAATKYSRFQKKFFHITWNRVIFDESDSVRGIKCLPKFNFMWLVTATYDNIMSNSNISPCFNGYCYNASTALQQILVKCDTAYIDKYLKFTNIERHRINCFMNKRYQIISSFITPSIQNMINGDDISGAMTALGGSSENKDTLVELISKKIQVEIDDKLAKIQYTRNIRSISDANRGRSNQKEQEKVESLKERLDSIKNTINNIQTDVCPICLDSYTNPVLLDCCNNIFCLECITTALKSKKQCVLCRKDTNTSHLTHISSTTSSKGKSPARLKTKEEACIEIILRDPQKKFLVFSDYDNSFTKLKDTLKANRVGHSEVKGNTDLIGRIVKKYNDGKYNVLFLNSRYAGAGLNLELTTDIIIYHNTELETQIIGRALRAGRDPELKLDIHYLLYENEVR